LAQNKTHAGVTTLPSGLQYEVMKAGDGAKPKSTDEVLVHYHGTLIDGTVFDSSVDRGQPISFPLDHVIAGWTEILQQMPVGSKWKVYIPYNLAYGERAAGPKIQPFSTLIFEIELLGIN
ncbi:MAG: FKBP-type peptidyl-prolyl cis-trans isomerase, partial [Saprospiraceae bacterium]